MLSLCVIEKDQQKILISFKLKATNIHYESTLRFYGQVILDHH
ncbi:MAG: hypothetical protein ACI8QP_001364 [Porticoccaceae bacterium]|jgi:hypothetical protein